MADPNKNNNNSRNINGKNNYNGSATEKTIQNSQEPEQPQQHQRQQQPQQQQQQQHVPAPVNAFDIPNLGQQFYLWCQECMRRLRGEALRHTATTRPTQFAPDAGTNTRKPGDASTSASEDNESQASKAENPNVTRQPKPKQSWLTASRRKIRARISSKIPCEGVYPYYTYFID